MSRVRPGPWRSGSPGATRAGLEDSDFAVGNEMRFVGEPSADSSKRLIKAERIFIGGKEYKLYPGRD